MNFQVLPLERKAITRMNGMEAIEIAIYKEGDANTVSVAKEVEERLLRVRETLHPELKIVKVYDQAVFIRQAVNARNLPAFLVFFSLSASQRPLFGQSTQPVVSPTFLIVDLYSSQFFFSLQIKQAFGCSERISSRISFLNLWADTILKNSWRVSGSTWKTLWKEGKRCWRQWPQGLYEYQSL
jgi:Cation/multidrug efflux pump